jgi:hypothetical protein
MFEGVPSFSTLLERLIVDEDSEMIWEGGVDVKATVLTS